MVGQAFLDFLHLQTALELELLPTVTVVRLKGLQDVSLIDHSMDLDINHTYPAKSTLFAHCFECDALGTLNIHFQHIYITVAEAPHNRVQRLHADCLRTRPPLPATLWRPNWPDLINI